MKLLCNLGAISLSSSMHISCLQYCPSSGEHRMGVPPRCCLLLNTQFTLWADSNMAASKRHRAKQVFASLCMFPSIRVSFDQAAFHQRYCARLSHHMDISCGGLAHRHRGVAGPVGIAGVNAESQMLPVILLQALCVSNRNQPHHPAPWRTQRVT